MLNTFAASSPEDDLDLICSSVREQSSTCFCAKFGFLRKYFTDLNISFGDNEFDLQDFKSPSKDYEKPNSSHDDYSIFEIVLKHDVKVRFTDLLNDIKEKKKYDKIEDSIIHIINSYDKKRK